MLLNHPQQRHAPSLPRSRQDLVRSQPRQLHALLAHLWPHSAFYREYYRSHGIREHDLAELTIRDLPFLTKATLMEHFDTAVTDPRLRKAELEHWLEEHSAPYQTFHQDFLVLTTSGSSGTIGIIVYDRPGWHTMNGLMAPRLPRPERERGKKTRVAFYLATHGHFTGVKSALQMSKAVYDPLLLSIFEPPDTVVAQLQTFQPHRLVGYASSIATLAAWTLQGRLHIRPPGVVVSGERLTSQMAQQITAAWSVPIHNLYSASESLYIGLQEAGQPEMVLMDDLNLVEVLDATHQPVGPGVSGRVVLTNLYNYALPIVRYELGDVVVRGATQDTHPFCTIREIQGRVTEALPIVLEGGTHDTIHPIGLPEFYAAVVQQVQLISLRPDHVRVEYVAAYDNDAGVRREVHRLLALKRALRTTFEVRRVAHFSPDSRTGKVPLVKIIHASGRPSGTTRTPTPSFAASPMRRPGPTNTFVLWTGGWDSTFRLLDLVLIKGSKVKPYYIIDSDRLSTSTEIRTMKNIKQMLFNKYPYTKSLLSATGFKEVSDIKPNALITFCFKEIRRNSYFIGSQYEWLARFADESGISNIELLIRKDDITDKALESFASRSFDKNGLYYRVKESSYNYSEYTLFKYFKFPIFNLNKLDLENIAMKNGFYDIMEHTWFCHKPRNNNSPCGICKPCIYTIEEGLGRRIPLRGRIMYHLAFPISEFGLCSCGCLVYPP